MSAWSIEKIIRIVEIALNVLLYTLKAFGVDISSKEEDSHE